METQWEQETILIYPSLEAIAKFCGKCPEAAFLLDVLKPSNSGLLCDKFPILKPFYLEREELKKCGSIKELEIFVKKIIEPYLKNPLNALANLVGLFLLSMKENMIGPSLTTDLCSKEELAVYEMDSIKNLLFEHYSKSGEEVYRKTGIILFIHTCMLIMDFDSTKLLKSLPLWKARMAYYQNQLLSSNIPHLRDSSEEFYKEFMGIYLEKQGIRCFETEKGREYKADSPEVLQTFGLLNIEFAYCSLTFYHYKSAQLCLEVAQAVGGIKHRLTGAKGRRTKYQEDAITQLILDITTQKISSEKKEEEKATPQKIALEEDSILFEQPVIEGEDTLLSRESSALSVYDQVYLNCFCRYQMVARARDVMTREMLYPYTAKVLEKSNAWLVFSYSLLLRSRNETDSTKRKERSIVQMQNLIDQFREKEPDTGSRLSLAFCSGYPLLWALRKEMANNYMQIGCFMSAYEMLKDMELNEDCVRCLFLSGKKSEAVEQAQALLKQNSPDCPKILCLLGDFAANSPEEREKYYSDAWKISKEKYPRALRSLGRLYFDQGKLKESIDCYERALKINSLYADSWFTLGCAYLRLENWEKALYAFGWVVQVDDNSTDGWSNLGVAYTQLNKYKQAVTCYEQALKISRDSWKIWQNYIMLSLEIPDLHKAISAIRQLIIMDMQKKIPVPILAKLASIIMSISEEKKEIVESFQSQLLKLLDEMTKKDSMNTNLWGLYADTYEIIKATKAKPEEKKKEYLNLVSILVNQCNSVMMNPNWECYEKFAEQLFEIFRVINAKHKEAGLEVAKDIQLLISNGILRVENYKGSKITL